jgi:transcriptional regulator with XRE-family HTH domain
MNADAIYYYRRPCIEIGQRIREIREARGWLQKELAYRAGVSTVLISRIERGGSIRVESLELIAAALDCDVEIVRRLP